jgi:peptidoglycan L-alanyl-D-glutamate endopeptidase CwlK
MDISEKRIQELHPKVRNEALIIYNICKERLTGRAEPIVVQGLRTFEYQQQLFDQGRTKAGNIVTNARPGLSYHNYGLAVDYALLIDGKTISWAFDKDWDADKIADFMEIVQVHKEFGWAWGGLFHTILDKPHFEKSFSLSVRQLLTLHNDRKFFTDTNYVSL